jgi:flagellar biosynthetic protein FlhB
MAPDRDRRTEKPSRRRLERAKEQGRIARSPDIGQAASLGAFLLWAALSGASFVAGLSAYLVASLRAAGRPPSEGALVDSLTNAAVIALRLLLPLLLTIAVVGLLAQAVQGLRLRRPPFRLDFARLAPARGLRRFAGVEALVASGKALLRAGCYALFAVAVVLPEWSGVAQLALSSPAGILAGTTRLVGRLLVRALVLGLVIAAADYAFARWRWTRSLRMTRQEVKDERRETEGSPELRSRVRVRQREQVRRRMTATVPASRVVVTTTETTP